MPEEKRPWGFDMGENCDQIGTPFENQINLLPGHDPNKPSEPLRQTFVKISIQILPYLIGLSIPIAIPLFQMITYNILFGHTVVDMDNCKCSCFDNLFKAPYESGVSGYKHFYFNFTSITLRLWILMIAFVLISYESFKRIVHLWIKGRLRISFLLVFLSTVPSNYYGVWAHWNYLNDEFFNFWEHQLVFTISELIGSIIALAFINSRRQTLSIPLIILGCIASCHILASTMDQFFSNVLLLGSFNFDNFHKLIRDLFLMSGDLLQLVIAIYELRILAKNKAHTLPSLLKKPNNLIALILTHLIFFLILFLCPEE